jgi:hypothetical protein
MAATEDDIARKRVQEAVWTWAGRVLVLAVTFGFGFFSAWVLWGSGTEGAPALREKVVQMDAQVLELKNKRVDIQGQLEVFQGRLDQCQKALTTARSGAPATP